MTLQVVKLIRLSPLMLFRWVHCSCSPFLELNAETGPCDAGGGSGGSSSTLLPAPFLSVQILRNGGPAFQENMRVILNTESFSGAHFYEVLRMKVI